MNHQLFSLAAAACLLLAGVFRSSRRPSRLLAMVMYQPVGTKPEFIEIWNISATPLDTARWTFTSGITFTFPDFNAGSSQAHFLRGFETNHSFLRG
jgi:hypothetical protein